MSAASYCPRCGQQRDQRMLLDLAPMSEEHRETMRRLARALTQRKQQSQEAAHG